MNTYLWSTVTGCVSVSAFASLVGTQVGIEGSALLIKKFIITDLIKTYKSQLRDEEETW